MAGGVDAAREPRHDRKTRFAELARETAGELHPGGRRLAGAHHRDHGPVHDGQMAAHRDQGRRVIDHPQAGRIAGLAERHEAHARGPCRLDLALGLRPQAGARRSARAAAAREVRERGERRLRATELIDQRAESQWPDILAANKTQPVEPLVIGQPDAVLGFVNPHAAP
jgi:hypothetical protein